MRFRKQNARTSCLATGERSNAGAGNAKQASMTRSSSQSIVTNRIVVALSIYALLGGLLTLAGWYLSVVRLTDWLGTGISMFANTALAAACLGVALLVHALRRSWSRPVTAALGVFAMLIGCGTLFEHFSGINLGIDTLLVQRSWGFRGATAPGRMGLPASFSVTLLGLAMLLLPHKGRGRYAVPLLGVVVSSIATLGLVGYLFRADPLFSVAKLTAIAMQTGTIILALGLGVMAAVPDLEPVRTLFRKSAAGLLVRRALPFSILLPMALGWGFITGRNAGWFDRGMGMALLTLASMALFCGLLRWCALALEAHEDALQKAQQELVQVNKELERRVEERTASLREARSKWRNFLIPSRTICARRCEA